ncbi:TonB family protein [Aminomonas paucivorans]|uniref:TonB family protein n=1 Tax=Aminomonas paucivorans TaxID=81412 RepID=UPI00331BFBF2
MKPYALPLLLSLGIHALLMGALGLWRPAPLPETPERVLVLRFAPAPPPPVAAPRRTPRAAPQAAPPEPRKAPAPAAAPKPPQIPPRRAAAPVPAPVAPLRPVSRTAEPPGAGEAEEVRGDAAPASGSGTKEASPPREEAAAPGGEGLKDAEVVDVRGVEVLRRVVPDYPPSCRRRGQEGTTVLVAQVEGGAVRSLRVERSSGFGALDEAAADALKRWRFARGVTASVRVPVIFRLQ